MFVRKGDDLPALIEGGGQEGGGRSGTENVPAIRDLGAAELSEITVKKASAVSKIRDRLQRASDNLRIWYQQRGRQRNGSRHVLSAPS